jgi:hypothetical protein
LTAERRQKSPQTAISQMSSKKRTTSGQTVPKSYGAPSKPISFPLIMGDDQFDNLLKEMRDDALKSELEVQT